MPKRKIIGIIPIAAALLLSCSGASENAISSIFSSFDSGYKSSDSISENPSSGTSSENVSSDSSSDSPSSGSSSVSVSYTKVHFGLTEYTSSVLFKYSSCEEAAIFSSVVSSNCYGERNTSIRVGSGKNIGILSFSLQTPLVVSEIRLYAAKYGSDDEIKASLNIGDSVIAEKPVTLEGINSFDEGDFLSFAFSPQSVSSFEISNCKAGARFSLSELVLVSGPNSGDSSSSSSSDGSSSSQESSSESSSNSSSEQSSSSSDGSSMDSSYDGALRIPSGLEGYYSKVDLSSKGKALKSSFSRTISSHRVLGYDGLWEAYETTDSNKEGKLVDMYSSYLWTPGAKQCGSYKKEGDCYNREHTVPQSVFGKASPMVCDVFHVYPTDGKVNGMRSNYPHGEVDPETVKYTSTNGCLLGKGTSSSGYAGTVFEPIDEYKGDFARTYFYMATCYESQISSWSDFGVYDSNSYPALKNWSRNLYLKWAKLDPVSEKERNRNDAAYLLQKNRNPFIDFPTLDQAIWG